MGEFLAGIHHLHLVQCTFGKDQHGLQERDINHKDKQNYDAVLYITSKSVMTSQIPDAKSISVFLDVIPCVLDSFRDQKLDAVSTVEKVWNAVFFMINSHKINSHEINSNFLTINSCIPYGIVATITNCHQSYAKTGEAKGETNPD